MDENEKSNIRSIFWARKEKERKERDSSEAQTERIVDAIESINDTMRRNAENKERVRIEREQHNKNVVRKERLNNK
jgi:hypothetical protein